MEKIVIATMNQGKAMEFKDFFKPYNIQALSLLDLAEDIDEVEENGTTFEENAQIKAETIASILNLPVIADDSGLVIDALNGKPGIHSARYAGKDKSDQANIDEVMKQLVDIPSEERNARFVCVLAISIPGEQTFFKKGICEGTIALDQAGTSGFGYDPIFIPHGYNQTMAELIPAEKNKISHRSHAINQLDDWIKQYKHMN